MHVSKIRTSLTLLMIAVTPAAFSQLPAPNEGGVSTGHVHLNVPDRAKHLEIWQSLGGELREGGRIWFPGMYIILTEREPEAPSAETSVNHIGFTVQDYSLPKAAFEAAGADIFFDNPETGQLLATLPDGVRVEIATEEAQPEPIAFHHVHLMVEDPEAIRDWYTALLAAEDGERRGLPSAVLPGGRVDFLAVRDEVPRGSRGAAIDHIGFEVADMDAFAARVKQLGLKFDVEPREIESVGITIAFLTDPIGTYIEITEGLADLE